MWHSHSQDSEILTKLKVATSAIYSKYKWHTIRPYSWQQSS